MNEFDSSFILPPSSFVRARTIAASALQSERIGVRCGWLPSARICEP
jgi:hypothetical protein